MEWVMVFGFVCRAKLPRGIGNRLVLTHARFEVRRGYKNKMVLK